MPPTFLYYRYVEYLVVHMRIHVLLEVIWEVVHWQLRLNNDEARIQTATINTFYTSTKK